MWLHDKARRVVQAYVDASTDGLGVILDDETLDRPYGWVFFYQSRAWVETKQIEQAFVGNAPIIFNRVFGTYQLTGTAQPVEHYIAEYERTLPPIQLARRPQLRDRSLAQSFPEGPSEIEAKIVALAASRIRMLLSGYLGSQNSGDLATRQAAHLAYAVHNEALAILERRHFDVHAVPARIGAVDQMLGSELRPLFDKLVQS